jgi:hypothetical protein
METKQINIIPPQGMEVVEEIKDGVKTISFKPVEEKKITYDDISKKLFFNKITYFIHSGGIISSMADTFNGNESLTEQEQEATLCEGMLRNVARYLNPEGWKYIPGVNEGWYFYINTSSNVDFSSEEFTFHSYIYFQSRELLNKAKEILGEEVIRKALIKQH